MTGTPPPSWVACPVQLTEGARFEIVVDAAAEDDISRAYRAGQGHLVNQHLLGIMLQLLEPGRLIELEAGQIQPTTVVDWLAVRGGPPALEGYRIEPPRGAEDLIAALISEGRLPTQDHRAYVAGALAGAPASLREDPRIVELLATLRADPVETVRRACDTLFP